MKKEKKVEFISVFDEKGKTLEELMDEIVKNYFRHVEPYAFK